MKFRRRQSQEAARRSSVFSIVLAVGRLCRNLEATVGIFLCLYVLCYCVWRPHQHPTERASSSGGGSPDTGSLLLPMWPMH